MTCHNHFPLIKSLLLFQADMICVAVASFNMFTCNNELSLTERSGQLDDKMVKDRES